MERRRRRSRPAVARATRRLVPTPDLTLALAALASLVGGTVRGFSGFGGALIFVPLISALYDPARAGPTLFVVDVILTAPLTLAALPRAGWREVAPMAAAAMLFTPLGVWLLAVTDPVLLRWAIAGAVAAILVVLMSGLRYAATPGLRATLPVGAVAGILGGAAQISGAPVAAFWLGGPGARDAVRANLIVFFALASMASGLSFWAAGLFDREVAGLALWLGPAYGLGVLIGKRWFVGASEQAYRRAAFAVIALAAVLSTPVWDGLWR